MAILRSRGGRSFASSPSSSTAPVVGSSRPATIRSTVDLPQPDGPSSTMNSPSLTSRLMVSTATVPSWNTLVTSLSATVVTVSSPSSSAESRNDCDEDHRISTSGKRAMFDLVTDLLTRDRRARSVR